MNSTIGENKWRWLTLFDCLSPGDRVAIEPGIPCRLCTICKEGHYNLCEKMIFCATPPYDGNLAHYYVHPADFCFKYELKIYNRWNYVICLRGYP